MATLQTWKDELDRKWSYPEAMIAKNELAEWDTGVVSKQPSFLRMFEEAYPGPKMYNRDMFIRLAHSKIIEALDTKITELEKKLEEK